jgi:hypothetical protein
LLAPRALQLHSAPHAAVISAHHEPSVGGRAAVTYSPHAHCSLLDHCASGTTRARRAPRVLWLALGMWGGSLPVWAGGSGPGRVTGWFGWDAMDR